MHHASFFQYSQRGDTGRREHHLNLSMMNIGIALDADALKATSTGASSARMSRADTPGFS
jgi:hypothetical protein